MHPRRRARNGNASRRGAVDMKRREKVSSQSKSRPDAPVFKQQIKHTFYRLVIILLVTLAVNYFRKPSTISAEDPWKVVDLPGRGKGMISTRFIKQGERIITERPLFIVPKEITENPTQLINSKIEGISPEQRAAFFALSHAHSNITEGEIPLSIFQTNGIAAGDSGVGIFPTTARLNHACSAGFNAVYHWREDEGILVVHTLKDVQAGNELLTTYFDTKRPKVERRDHLEQIYKFSCSCSVCSLPAAASQASDTRLQGMASAYAKFSSWGRGEIDGLEALNLVRKIWRLGEEEAYWSERGQLAADAAHVAAAHSDAHATQMWATLAEKWYGYELGSDSKQSSSIRVIAADSRRHVAWASRERMVVGDLNYKP